MNLPWNKSSGNLFYSPGDQHLSCCCFVACSQCFDSTPATYTVTFSGVSEASCVLLAGSYWSVASGTLNGTWTLSPDPSGTTCLWDTTFPLTVNVYSDSGCTIQINTFNCVMRISLDATANQLLVQSISTTGTFDVLLFRNDSPFVGGQGPFENQLLCASSFPTDANSYTAYAISLLPNIVTLGINGSATISTP